MAGFSSIMRTPLSTPRMTLLHVLRVYNPQAAGCCAGNGGVGGGQSRGHGLPGRAKQALIVGSYSWAASTLTASTVLSPSLLALLILLSWQWVQILTVQLAYSTKTLHNIIPSATWDLLRLTASSSSLQVSSPLPIPLLSPSLFFLVSFLFPCILLQCE